MCTYNKCFKDPSLLHFYTVLPYDAPLQVSNMWELEQQVLFLEGRIVRSCRRYHL